MSNPESMKALTELYLNELINLAKEGHSIAVEQSFKVGVTFYPDDTSQLVPSSQMFFTLTSTKMYRIDKLNEEDLLTGLINELTLHKQTLITISFNYSVMSLLKYEDKLYIGYFNHLTDVFIFHPLHDENFVREQINTAASQSSLIKLSYFDLHEVVPITKESIEEWKKSDLTEES